MVKLAKEDTKTWSTVQAGLSKDYRKKSHPAFVFPWLRIVECGATLAVQKLEENDLCSRAIVEYWLMLKDLDAKDHVEVVMEGIRYCRFRNTWNPGIVMLEVRVSGMSDNLEWAWIKIRAYFARMRVLPASTESRRRARPR